MRLNLLLKLLRANGVVKYETPELTLVLAPTPSTTSTVETSKAEDVTEVATPRPLPTDAAALALHFLGTN